METHRISGRHCEDHRPTRTGRFLGGLVLISIGAVLLAWRMGVWMPAWIISWKMLLIAIGLFMIAKNSFRRMGGGLILIFIGMAFLFEDLYPGFNLRMIFLPGLIILFGLIFMFGPSRFRGRRRFEQRKTPVDPAISNSDNYIDVTSIFGGTKKTIFSKDFRGGEVVNVFGGTELNLTQAGIQTEATLDVTQVFGGTKLIIPAGWRVRSEISAIFGGIDDKRQQGPAGDEGAPLLILVGTAIFAGIDIRNF